MKKSFTLLELVFVIVLIGIISAVMIPRTGSNSLREAAIQLVSHIKYTQHLAMMDDKFDLNDIANNKQWFQSRWQLVFSTSGGGMFYWIFSDFKGSSTGNPDANSASSEVAKNPLNSNLYLIGSTYRNFFAGSANRISKELDLKNKYGIKDVKFTGGSASTTKRIMFDHLGRPIQGTTNGGSQIKTALEGLLKSKLYIKLCKDSCVGDASVENSDEIRIVIEPETGYTKIL